MADADFDIVDRISDLLAEKKTREVKAIMMDEKYDPVIRKRADDLIPIAAFYIDHKSMIKNPVVFRRSVKLLEMCAEKGNPKEGLLEFLVQIESMDEVKFEVLLKPIQTTLLRIPDRKASLMNCVFHVIHMFLRHLKLPHAECLIDKKSALLLDSDLDSQRIINAYGNIVGFYKPFVDEVTSVIQEDKRIVSIKKILIYALIHLLDHPMMAMDLEFNDNKYSNARVLCSKVVGMILKIQPDPLKFLVLVDNKDFLVYDPEFLQQSDSEQNEFYSKETRFTHVSLTVFFYLIFGENMCSAFPNVYDKLFLFQNCSTLAVIFLQTQYSIVLRKGLILLKAILEITDPSSVPFSYLHSDDHKNTINFLSDVAVFNDIEENRKFAVDLIKQYFFAFEPKAQFYILLNVVKLKQHPNINGFFTTMLTTVVRNVFNDEKLHEYFTGKRLFVLLKTYCSLKNGVQTDLIENKDQILSALNLLIFLTVRDKENITGVWNYINNVSDSFLSPLREAIDISRAHYELQLKTLDDSNLSEGPEFSINVGGQDLERINTEEKKKVMNSGLVVFDLIEHLLCRVQECVGDKKRPDSITNTTM